jgi:predicted permease
MLPLRYAFRSLRRSPGFVAVTVLCLGLGLGLTTTAFSVVDAALNPYVPYRDPDAVFRVFQFGDGANHDVRSLTRFRVLRRASSFAGIAAVQPLASGAASVAGNMANMDVVSVSENFFTVLGLSPRIGRFFGAGTDPGVAVVSYDTWRLVLNGRHDLSATTLVIAGRQFAVIGVAPRGMEAPFFASAWVPLPAGDASLSEARRMWLLPYVRLRPGVTLAQAEAEMAVLASRLTAEHGTGHRSFEFALFPIRPRPLGLHAFHKAMLGATFAVLLIACGNLGTLMLARGLNRRRDVALYLAIGATRGAVVRQVMTECLIVALAGGAVGALLAVWGIDILAYHWPPRIRWIGLIKPALNWRVFAFAALAAVASALGFGLWPAIRSSDVDVSEPLKDAAGTTTGRMRLRFSALVIAEVALSLVLLLGAGALVKTVQRIKQFDFGYDRTGLLVGGVNTYADSAFSRLEARQALFEDILMRARTATGVVSAALFTGDAPAGEMVVPDYAADGSQRLLLKSYQRVSPSFLRTLGVRVLLGRDFEEGDRRGVGGVILDEDAAKALWPHRSPVGQLLKLGEASSSAPWVPVVGVARHASLDFEQDPDMSPEPLIYRVAGTFDTRQTQIVVRTRVSDEAGVSRHLRQSLQAAMPSSSGPAVYVMPWTTGFDEFVEARGFIARLFGLFGVIGLTLAAAGLYAVLAYAVSQRMREFGVRIALGANRRDLLKLVLHDGMVMVLAGMASGAVLSLWAEQILRAWLYNVDPTDAVALVGAELVLLVVSLGACVGPALRATRADPLEILRAT